MSISKDKKSFPLPDNSLNIKIIFEDDYILALDKPANVPTQPLRQEEKGTVANFIAYKFPEILGIGDKPLEPGLVHRLDIKTSGLLLVAKTNDAFKSLREQFKNKKIRKNYYALVYGNVKEHGIIDLPLAHKKVSRKRMIVVDKDKIKFRGKKMDAYTLYKIIKPHKDFTLLNVEIKTGVMHQIRCHLAYLGHPVIGEDIYKKNIPEDSEIKTNRYFLHAHKLILEHPNTQKSLEIFSKLPSEFSMFLSPQ